MEQSAKEIPRRINLYHSLKVPLSSPQTARQFTPHFVFVINMVVFDSIEVTLPGRLGCSCYLL
jgi:hypothetical protein